MKFYRVETFVEFGTSAGMSWHASRRDADKAAQEDNANAHPDERKPQIDEVEIEPTKAGILRALRQYATHPDNG